MAIEKEGKVTPYVDEVMQNSWLNLAEMLDALKRAEYKGRDSNE
jgi:hypothetical protein